MRVVLIALAAVLLVDVPRANAEFNGAGDTTVIGGGDDVQVIVENDGGDVVVVVGGEVCTFHKLTVLELAQLPGLPVDLPADQGSQFVSRTEEDGTTSYLYVRQCGAEFDHFWIRDLPPDDVVEAARQELIEIAPPPAPEFSPVAGVDHLVGLPTFVWLEAGSVRPLEVTASIPGLWATATATPAAMRFDPGDGTAVRTCELEARPYEPGADPAQHCAHTYTGVSSRRPSGAFVATVAVEWTVTWVNSLGETGVAEPLETTAVQPIVVVEAQPRLVND